MKSLRRTTARASAGDINRIPAEAQPVKSAYQNEFAAEDARIDAEARERWRIRVLEHQVHYVYELADLAVNAILKAADRMEVDPLQLARRLGKGEIADLVTYVRAASHHVPDHRVQWRMQVLASSLDRRL